MIKGVNPRSVVQSIPMFRAALLFVLGILIGDFLGDAVGAVGWLVCFSVLTIAAYILYKVNEMLCSVAILIAIVISGCMRISYNNESLDYISADVSRVCEVVVISDPVVRGKVIMFDCADVKDGYKIRCSLLRDTITGRYKTVHIGDGLRANMDMTPLRDWHRINPHFDYVRWLKARNFVGRGFIGIDKWEKKEMGLRDMSVWNYVIVKLLVFRDAIQNDIKDTGMDADAFAVATAMAFGNKGALSADLRDDYNMAGASHILALSGMHLSIIYIILMFIIGKRYSKKLKVMTLCMVWLYVFFVGMPLSVVRAACMLTLWEVIGMMENSQYQLNVFGLTMLLMVAVSPQSIWDVGFQMSFSAVFAIIAFMGPMNKIMPRSIRPLNKKKKRKMKKSKIVMLTVLRKMWYTIAISCSAQIGTLPLTVYYFGRIPLLFILTNVFVIPMAVAVIGGMLVMACVVVINMILGGWLWNVVKVVGCFVNCIVMLQNWVLRFIANIPGASVEGIDVSGVQTIGAYVIIVGVMLFLNRKEMN